MKTLIVASLFLAFSFTGFSQDTLFKRNGEVILGKVTEINKTDIKYKKNNNPDGPTYSIGIDDVTMIEYKNGSKDVFQSGAVSNEKADDVYANGPKTQVNNNYYATPVPRPGVNVVLGMGVPYWGPGWGWYRPYPRPYYYHGWGGYHHYHHGWRRH
ncbi:MAG: hypothetical protein ACXVPN_03000 [Bacteroidia bacterium]